MASSSLASSKACLSYLPLHWTWLAVPWPWVKPASPIYLSIDRGYVILGLELRLPLPSIPPLTVASRSLALSKACLSYLPLHWPWLAVPWPWVKPDSPIYLSTERGYVILGLELSLPLPSMPPLTVASCSLDLSEACLSHLPFQLPWLGVPWLWVKPACLIYLSIYRG